MTIAQLSPNSVAASPAYVNPQIKTDQATAMPQVNHDSQKSFHLKKTDTVTISPQALQKLASDGDNQALEVRETGAEKVTETFRGKA